jgi:uncharacterized phiE125 gp8 family phage protein
LSLADFKEFLRLDPSDTSEDTILNLILSSVQSTFERYTGLVLQPTVFDMEIDPLSIQRVLPIAKNPVTEITSAEVFIDTAFVAVDDFDTKLGYNSHVHLINNDTNSDTHERYKVRFTAGLTTIPDDIILAMYQHAAFAYENRGDCSLDACGFPSFIVGIYDSYKVLCI